MWYLIQKYVILLTKYVSDESLKVKNVSLIVVCDHVDLGKLGIWIEELKSIYHSIIDRFVHYLYTATGQVCFSRQLFSWALKSQWHCLRHLIMWWYNLFNCSQTTSTTATRYLLLLCSRLGRQITDKAQGKGGETLSVSFLSIIYVYNCMMLALGVVWGLGENLKLKYVIMWWQSKPTIDIWSLLRLP